MTWTEALVLLAVVTSSVAGLVMQYRRCGR